MAERLKRFSQCDDPRRSHTSVLLIWQFILLFEMLNWFLLLLLKCHLLFFCRFIISSGHPHVRKCAVPLGTCQRRCGLCYAGRQAFELLVGELYSFITLQVTISESIRDVLVTFIFHFMIKINVEYFMIPVVPNFYEIIVDSDPKTSLYENIFKQNKIQKFNCRSWQKKWSNHSFSAYTQNIRSFSAQINVKRIKLIQDLFS